MPFIKYDHEYLTRAKVECIQRFVMYSTSRDIDFFRQHPGQIPNLPQALPPDYYVRFAKKYCKQGKNQLNDAGQIKFLDAMNGEVYLDYILFRTNLQMTPARVKGLFKRKSLATLTSLEFNKKTLGIVSTESHSAFMPVEQS